MTDIDFPPHLFALESAAWTEIQAGTLTVDIAHAVHAAVSEYAEQAGLRRIDVELGLKAAVRYRVA